MSEPLLCRGGTAAGLASQWGINVPFDPDHGHVAHCVPEESPWLRRGDLELLCKQAVHGRLGVREDVGVIAKV